MARTEDDKLMEQYFIWSETMGKEYVYGKSKKKDIEFDWNNFPYKLVLVDHDFPPEKPGIYTCFMPSISKYDKASLDLKLHYTEEGEWIIPDWVDTKRFYLNSWLKDSYIPYESESQLKWLNFIPWLKTVWR